MSRVQYSLRAPADTQSAWRLRAIALRYIRTWRITKDQQGCHHQRPTSNKPWDIRQTKDNPQPRHHAYATDYYCSLTTYGTSQQTTTLCSDEPASKNEPASKRTDLTQLQALLAYTIPSNILEIGTTNAYQTLNNVAASVEVQAGSNTPTLLPNYSITLVEV